MEARVLQSEIGRRLSRISIHLDDSSMFDSIDDGISRREAASASERLRNDSFLSTATKHQSRGDPRERVLPRSRMLPERLFAGQNWVIDLSPS